MIFTERMSDLEKFKEKYELNEKILKNELE